MKILKLAKQSISNHLSKIFNVSFSLGIFAEILETEKVTPIFKKGSKLECSNYRPIPLLSSVNKIFEKVKHKKVLQVLNEHISYQEQFGFQKDFSTAHAIIKFIEDIKKSLDNKQAVCAVFINLQKTFDAVNTAYC